MVYRKLLFSAIVVLLVQLSLFKAPEDLSKQYLDQAFKRSLSVFAIARGMNGLISVVQGTELYATPAGVGVNFALGEILDPINDMVERFSWVMLFSTVSLGIQELVLEMTQVNGLNALLALSGVVMLVMMWLPKCWHHSGFELGFKLFVLLAFVRFFVPLTLVGNEVVYKQILEPKYLSAKEALAFNYTQSQSIVTQLNHAKVDHNQAWYESLNIKEQISRMQARVERMWQDLQQKFDKAIDYMLVLIAIFAVQSVLFPLVFLWVLLHLYRRINHIQISTFFETK